MQTQQQNAAIEKIVELTSLLSHQDLVGLIECLSTRRYKLADQAAKKFASLNTI